MIDIRQLTYFVAVVEAKSFTAASELLCIAQPALSQHLQRLEHDFGHRLLIRHSKGVEPTAAGVRLVEHARSILMMLDAAKSDLRNFDEQPRGRVRLGMPRSLCDALGVDLMMAWPQEHPSVALQIVEQASSELIKSVHAGRVDLAVSSYPSDESDALIGEPLLSDKMCAILPRTADTSILPDISFAQVAAEPLILYSQDNVTRQLIDMTAEYASVKLNLIHEIDSPLLALDLAETGIGVTIQPYLAVRGYLRSKRVSIRPISGPSITRRLHLIRSRHRPLNAYEQEVLNVLREHLPKQLASERPLIEFEVTEPS